MEITAIKAQIKNPDRVSIYVNNAYAFSFNHNQLLQQKIHVGLEINEAQLAELKKVSDFGKAYERALMYAMLRPRSVWEMWQYARRKQWAPEDTRLIVEKLMSKGYVNDLTFAKAWVQSRVYHKTVSFRRLQQELKQKGVADGIIAVVLADDSFNEQESLKKLIAKKQKLSRYQDRQKLVRYLVGQGFKYEDITTALS